jgi:cytochrome c-type biogenesis protein CcmF
MDRWGLALLVAGTALALTAVAAHLASIGRRIPLIAAPGLLTAAAALTTAAFALLAYRFASTDIRLTVVADYSARTGPLPHRLAGAWAGLEGSLLLWTAAIGLIAAAAARRHPATVPITAALAGVLGLIGLLFANPFERLDLPPLDGAGLTPILRHPAMLFHPLLVYGGLVALVVPFALAVRRPPGWLDAARRWGTGAWALLTFALFTGGIWAYVEVGWGGYWAWDPVENGALIPWLAGLAFLHAARPAAALSPRLLAGLAGLPLLGVLVGATVTRSGWAASVHSFAEGRTVGVSFVALTLAAGVTLALAIWRAAPAPPPAPEPPPTTAAPAPATAAPAAALVHDRHLATVAGLAVASAAVVAVGTLWPFLAELGRARPRAVGGQFFAWPVAVMASVAAVLIATGPMRSTARGNRLRRLAARGAAAAAAAAMAVAAGRAAGLGWAGTGLAGGSAVALLGAGWGWRVGAWRARGALGHAGFALLVLGVAATTAAEERSVLLAEGEAVKVGPYVVANTGLSDERETRLGADLVVLRRDREAATLRPALIAYPQWGRVVPETDRLVTPLGDLQTSLDWADDTGRVRVTVRWIPLIGLVWVGPVLMTAAGAVAALRPTPRPLADSAEAGAPGAEAVAETTAPAGVPSGGAEAGAVLGGVGSTRAAGVAAEPA